jgi:hypothetical protein
MLQEEPIRQKDTIGFHFSITPDAFKARMMIDDLIRKSGIKPSHHRLEYRRSGHAISKAGLSLKTHPIRLMEMSMLSSCQRDCLKILREESSGGNN